MTLALTGYSSIFMRYAFAVTPKNYLLFGCHIVNFSAQLTQGYRYMNYWHFGGREKLEREGKKGASGFVEGVEAKAGSLADEAKSSVKDAAGKVDKGLKDAKKEVTGK